MLFRVKDMIVTPAPSTSIGDIRSQRSRPYTLTTIMQKFSNNSTLFSLILRIVFFFLGPHKKKDLKSESSSQTLLKGEPTNGGESLVVREAKV